MFEGAKLKIKRANKHIADFQSAIEAFVNEGFYNFPTKHDIQTGDVNIGLETDSLPDDIPLIVGDAVHCLRGCLDHVWNDLTKRVTGSESEDYFPIHETRKSLESAIDKGIVKTHYPQLRSVILDDIEPTKTGKGSVIWNVNRLDRADKHRKLILTIGEIEAIPPTITSPGGGYIGNNRIITTAGKKHGYVSIQGKIPVTLHNDGKATISVIFGKGEFFENEPVAPTLIQASQAFANAINLIEGAIGV